MTKITEASCFIGTSGSVESLYKESFYTMAMQEKESFVDKLIRKSTAEPLVPIGAVATLVCLGAGLRAFHQGQAATSQRLMRGRVLAQGFTVVVMLAGAAYGFKPGGHRPKTYGEKMRLEQEQREREINK